MAIGIAIPTLAGGILQTASALGFLCSGTTALVASWRKNKAKKVREAILLDLAFFASIFAFVSVIS